MSRYNHGRLRRRILNLCAGLLLALLIFGAAAPFLHADRYRNRVQQAMSAALGRQVSIDGSVTLNLFSGPGISVADVRIADEPGAGAEPFAYVDEVIAIPRIWSFWTGRIEFSSLTLNGAHVNLSRAGRVSNAGSPPSWNFTGLARPNVLAAFPVIRMRDSRINFKVDGRKTTFYLMNVDLDIAPRARDGSQWDLRLTGQPARSDRPARGFGAIEARGRWTRGPATGGHTEIDVRLVRSEIGDIVALIYGHDAGVHGIVAGAIHVAGEPAALGIDGEVRVSELHGWAQSPPSGGAFPFRVSGTADLSGERFELFAEPKTAAAPLRLHFTAMPEAQRTTCAFDLRSDGLPISGIPGLLRNFGAKLPEGFQIEGLLDGSLHIQTGAAWTGSATVRQVALISAHSPALNLASASITVGSGGAVLAPSEMVSDGTAVGDLAGHYNLADRSYGIEITSNGGSLAAMLRALPGVTVPVLSTAQSGQWTGDLAYTEPAAGESQWTASGTLTDAEIRLPQLAEPVLLNAARVQMTGPALQMDRIAFTAGGVTGTGDYRYVPGAPRPHQFHLGLGDSSVAAIGALLKPTIAREHSLLDRALNLGRESPPAWLETMQADGFVQARTLLVEDTELHRVRAHVEWDGSTITLPDLAAAGDKFTVASKLTIRLSGATPRYIATARITGLPWQGGTVNGTVAAQTSGADEAGLLSNLRLSGTFDAQEPTVPPLGELDAATGQFEADWRDQNVAVRFPRLRIVNAEGDIWTGAGTPGAQPGEVILQLTNHTRRMILAGSLTDERRSWVEQ